MGTRIQTRKLLQGPAGDLPTPLYSSCFVETVRLKPARGLTQGEHTRGAQPPCSQAWASPERPSHSQSLFLFSLLQLMSTIRYCPSSRESFCRDDAFQYYLPSFWEHRIDLCPEQRVAEHRKASPA